MYTKFQVTLHMSDSQGYLIKPLSDSQGYLIKTLFDSQGYLIKPLSDSQGYLIKPLSDSYSSTHQLHCALKSSGIKFSSI